MKNKLLMIIQLPPPIHGVSVANETLTRSESLFDLFDISIVDYRFSNTIEGMQKNSILKFFKFFILFFRILFCILFKRPDVVYFTIAPLGSSFYRDSVVVFFLKLFRLKICLHIHGKGISEVSNDFAIKYYKFILKNCTVISISKILSLDLRKVYPVDEIKVCMNGVKSCSINKNEIKNVDSKNKNLNILFFSNLLPMKGLDIFLDVAKRASLINKELMFYVAGPVNLKFTKSDISKFYQDNPFLVNRVVFCGPLYGDEKIELLSKMDLIVHPTKNDALPLVLLEAMSAGLCVLSSGQGGIPDLIEDGINGFVFKDNNADDYVNKIIFLNENRDVLQRMSECAFISYENFLTEKKFAERVADILFSVVSS